MKNTQEKIAIMQAFIEGKKIETCLVGTDDWVPTSYPIWDWLAYDYRIKHMPKLRPYTFEELQAEMAKGKISVKIKSEGINHIYTITQVRDDYEEAYKIQLSDWRNISYEQLLEDCQWLDNTPCGVIEEE